jgi:hypothetical protein
MVDVVEGGPHGSRTVKRAEQLGGPDNAVEIRGYGRDHNFTQFGIVHPGFALTPNVPKAFWDLWLKQNAGSDLVLNGLIFAHKQEASVRRQVLDHEDIRSGLEPIQQAKAGEKPTDPRMKGFGKHAVTTADKDD